LVEGITEWLPVSSTGHLILLDALLPQRFGTHFFSLFEVVIQLGAILAVPTVFWRDLTPLGKPPEERRLGDLYEDKTGLYRHREWRGVKDTMYYFNNIWLYNYIMMVGDIMKFGGPVLFAKGLWRYRWLGQTYLPVLHWFDRGLEGLRGEALRASAWHYRAMVCVTINQFMNMFKADGNLRNGEHNDAWHHSVFHKETV
jgi:hypothetical protein